MFEKSVFDDKRIIERLIHELNIDDIHLEVDYLLYVLIDNKNTIINSDEFYKTLHIKPKKRWYNLIKSHKSFDY